MAAALATKPRPLDVSTFRAYKHGKNDDYPATGPSFGRFAKALSRAFVGIGATVPAFSYEAYSSAVEAGSSAGKDERCVTVLLQAADADYAARLHLEPDFIFALCDLVFGGSGTEAAYQEERPLSHIENEMAYHFAEIFGEQLPHAFQEAKLAAFIRYKPPADGLGEPPDFKPALRITLLATMMGFSGDLIVECNELLGNLLSGKPKGAGEGEPAESAYSQAIASHVEKTDVDVMAILSSVDMTLGELSTLSPGQLIRLGTALGKPIIVESDGVVIHQARLGQQSNRFCLSIL